MSGARRAAPDDDAPVIAPVPVVAPSPKVPPAPTARRGLVPPELPDWQLTRQQPVVAPVLGEGLWPGGASEPTRRSVATAAIATDAEQTRVQPAIRDDAWRDSTRGTGAGPVQRGRSRRAEPEFVSTGEKVRGWVLQIVFILVVALIISALVRAFLVQMFEVPSVSMEKTLLKGDRIVAVEFGDYVRGDMVVFKDPGGWLPGLSTTKEIGSVRRALELLRVLPRSTEDYLVKRVIGVAGDHVQCCDALGQVMVNGVSLDERAYLFAENGETNPPSRLAFDVWVPEGTVFVLGDHRDMSADSRVHLCETSSDGPVGSRAFVPEDNVVGPVKAIGWPLNRLQGFRTPASFAEVPDHPDGEAPDDPVVHSDQCPA